MSSNMTAVQRAILYTASGGFLTIVFGLLGTAAAQAAPDKGAPAKIANVDKSNDKKTPAAPKNEAHPEKKAGVKRSGEGPGPRSGPGAGLKREKSEPKATEPEKKAEKKAEEKAGEKKAGVKRSGEGPGPRSGPGAGLKREKSEPKATEPEKKPEEKAEEKKAGVKRSGEGPGPRSGPGAGLRREPKSEDSEKKESEHEKKDSKDEKQEKWVEDLQRTAKGRAQYGSDQQGGNPGTGLKRQLERAKDEAAEARRGNTQRVTETDAEVKRLEERQAKEAAAAKKRQGKKEKYGPPMPEPRNRESTPHKSEAPGKTVLDQALESLGQPQPKSVEDRMLSLESKQEREKREESLRELQRTAKGRAQYGSDQQGGNPGTGLKRQLQRARGEAAEARRGNTQRVTETEAEVKRLEERQAKEAAAAKKRQGKKEKYGPPMPEPRERSLQEMLDEGDLGGRSSTFDPLDPYGRLRNLTRPSTPPAPPQETTATPAPPPAAQQRPSKRDLEVAELVRRHNERMAAMRSQREAKERQKAEEEALAKAAEEERQRGIDEYNKKHGKPNGSVSVCAGGNLQAFTGGAVDGCLTADSRGLGWSADQDAGAGAGVSAGVGLSVKRSSANIDEIPGESYAGSVSGKAGAGGTLSGSITRDGKHHTEGYGVGVGFGGGVMVGVENSQSGRIFDWPTLPSWEDLARYGAENPPGYGT